MKKLRAMASKEGDWTPDSVARSAYTSQAVLRTIAHADALLGKHEFDVNPGLKESASPKRSASGLYYLDCVDCGRAVRRQHTDS